MANMLYAPLQKAEGVYKFAKDWDEKGLKSAVANMSAPPFQKADGV